MQQIHTDKVMNAMAWVGLRKALQTGERGLDAGWLLKSAAETAHMYIDCEGLDLLEEIGQRRPRPKSTAVGVLKAPKNAASVT